jgi:hypothetical protein
MNTFTVYALYYGEWLSEATFDNRKDAVRYIKNSKFWDGTTREIR